MILVKAIFGCYFTQQKLVVYMYIYKVHSTFTVNMNFNVKNGELNAQAQVNKDADETLLGHNSIFNFSDSGGVTGANSATRALNELLSIKLR